MLKLGVNIDHVATLREARYIHRLGGEPDPVKAALICEQAGAAGITAHLREDRRHIQDRDIYELRRKIRTRLNLEMTAAPEIVSIALAVKPDIVCLVPERRREVTTEGGLDAKGARPRLEKTVKQLGAAGIPVSLFIGPDASQVRAAAQIGAEYIELHTGAFSEHFKNRPARQRELRKLIDASNRAVELGLRVNAGHGLNYENLDALFVVPNLEELNIGHSIISRAISTGISAAVREMLKLMRGYRAEAGKVR